MELLGIERDFARVWVGSGHILADFPKMLRECERFSLGFGWSFDRFWVEPPLAVVE